MNALGWSLEDARAYLQDQPFLSQAMIETETLRYSTDIPGQALAYKLGDFYIRALRERAKTALGDQFDKKAACLWMSCQSILIGTSRHALAMFLNRPKCLNIA